MCFFYHRSSIRDGYYKSKAREKALGMIRTCCISRKVSRDPTCTTRALQSTSSSWLSSHVYCLMRIASVQHTYTAIELLERRRHAALLYYTRFCASSPKLCAVLCCIAPCSPRRWVAILTYIYLYDILFLQKLEPLREMTRFVGDVRDVTWMRFNFIPLYPIPYSLSVYLRTFPSFLSFL